jgi:hypothetical protein
MTDINELDREIELKREELARLLDQRQALAAQLTMEALGSPTLAPNKREAKEMLRRLDQSLTELTQRIMKAKVTQGQRYRLLVLEEELDSLLEIRQRLEAESRGEVQGQGEEART